MCVPTFWSVVSSRLGSIGASLVPNTSRKRVFTSTVNFPTFDTFKVEVLNLEGSRGVIQRGVGCYSEGGVFLNYSTKSCFVVMWRSESEG